MPPPTIVVIIDPNIGHTDLYALTHAYGAPECLGWGNHSCFSIESEVQSISEFVRMVQGGYPTSSLRVFIEANASRLHADVLRNWLACCPVLPSSDQISTFFRTHTDTTRWRRLAARMQSGDWLAGAALEKLVEFHPLVQLRWRFQRALVRMQRLFRERYYAPDGKGGQQAIARLRGWQEEKGGL